MLFHNQRKIAELIHEVHEVLLNNSERFTEHDYHQCSDLLISIAEICGLTCLEHLFLLSKTRNANNK